MKSTWGGGEMRSGKWRREGGGGEEERGVEGDKWENLRHIGYFVIKEKICVEGKNYQHSFSTEGFTHFGLSPVWEERIYPGISLHICLWEKKVYPQTTACCYQNIGKSSAIPSIGRWKRAPMDWVK